MTLDEARANIGAGVVRRTGILEYGVITSVNDTYIFVRYHKDMHSKATNPKELEFLSRIPL